MVGDALVDADAALLLSDADIASIEPTCREYAQLMKQALRRQGTGELVSTPKYGVRLPDRGEWFAMPAGSTSDGAVGVKWVGTTAPNPSGRPTVNGLIVLNDPVTGDVVAIMSAQRITAGRTAAVTAVALELFAVAATQNVCLVGTGSEARAHVRMIDELFPGVETVSVVSRSSLRAQEFCLEMTGSTRLSFLSTAAPEAAVRAADAVIVTSSRADVLIRPEWLSSGSTTVFVSGVLGAADVLAAVDLIYVDDLPLLSTPEGRARFPYGVPEASADMASVQCGRAVGRTSAQQRVAVVPFGMGAFDISAAEFVFRRAQDAGVGGRWRC